MSITRRQFEILRWIDQFIATQGYSPSYEEIGVGCGLSSLATVHKHVRRLEQGEFIRTQYNRSRSIDVTLKANKILRNKAGALLLRQAKSLLNL